jgi:hypothetical protein
VLLAAVAVLAAGHLLIVVAVGLGLLAGDQDPGQGGVTSKAPGRLRRQRPDPAKLPTKTGFLAQQAGQVHRDQQLGSHPTRSRQAAGL